MADYTVKKGDTLWDLAEEWFGLTNDTQIANKVKELASINGITDPNYIVVGQELNKTGSPATETVNTTSKPTINVFGLQSNTDRTMYATWTWSKSNTKDYTVMWYYDTGDGVWFVGTNSTVTEKQSLYSAPQNALKVKFKVKANSETRNVNNKETAYWTGAWSTEKQYSFSDNPPTTPSVPTVEIKGLTLTASLDNLDVNGTEIEFEIVKDNTSVFNTGKAKITTTSASYSCSVNAGSDYKVRARSIRGSLQSTWSQYSNSVGTPPAAPGSITACRATSETSVYLEWEAVKNAESYDIEYTTEKRYFEGSDQTQTVSVTDSNHYEKTGLTAGEEYFFRVRAVNLNGKSAWTDIKSVAIGKAPTAPTTWSSTTTAIIGEPLNLYWVHNSQDESSQKFAELELDINGLVETYTIENTASEEDKDKTSSHAIDTTEYDEGVKIQWRVRTCGITNVYGEWSTQRTVDIYAPPTMELTVVNANNSSFTRLTSFPFYISALAGPNTQRPIGFHVSIVPNDTYETVDDIGNIKTVNSGEAVYSKYFDSSTNPYALELSANDVNLENNVDYTIICTASMDSGLTAEGTFNFAVAWTDIQYEPNAEIGIDKETFSAYIRPHCEDEKGNKLADVLLSVYRREFDGTFTELAKDLDNSRNIFITDPHPSLDYARYRIVAKTEKTGSISYCDLPGYPIGGTAVIIQWDEEWSTFDTTNEDELEQPPWSGSFLKLPYNIDVTNSVSPDVTFIQYIGRQHPVSYYGTHVGETASWNVTIAKDDKDTIYALRRLARWMGDVYVREPSGTGYWANVRVSFPQKHCDVIVPVTLDITRVEGGI